MIFSIFLFAFVVATALAVGAILVLAITGALAGRRSSPTLLGRLRLSGRLDWIAVPVALVWGLALVWMLALVWPKG
jgi:hypothetical protein